MKSIFKSFVLCLFVLPLAAQPARVRALILTGESDLPYHDWRVSTPFLRGVLENSGRFDVKVAEEVRGLNGPALSGYDVLVLNYSGRRWGRETEGAVEEFIRSGKGMIAVHGVSYGYFFGMVFDKRWQLSPSGDKGWEAYAEMMGMTWKPENIGHSARHVFPVKWVDRGHPISRGLEETFLANDELYHRMDHKPNIHVLATAYSDPKVRGTGKDEPIIWTAPFGKGRVVHMTLGHDTAAMYQPGFLAAFARGTEWAATGAVTPPASRPDAVRLLVVTGGHGFPTSFYALFEGWDDLRWSHAATQAEAFRPGLEKRFDVILFHDMYETIGDAAQSALRSYVEAGKGIVSTHHAIVNYTSWPWWHEEVVGGKYFTQALGPHAKSAYKEGVEFVAAPVKAARNHPVLKGLELLPVEDEVYKGMWHSPRIQVLMETAHPLNDTPVVYVGPHPKAKSVYIQLGHGEYTMRHPGYRKLIHNAILWAAGRER